MATAPHFSANNHRIYEFGVDDAWHMCGDKLDKYQHVGNNECWNIIILYVVRRSKFNANNIYLKNFPADESYI